MTEPTQKFAQDRLRGGGAARQEAIRRWRRNPGRSFAALRATRLRNEADANRGARRARCCRLRSN
jgi:hypothetical protein